MDSYRRTVVGLGTIGREGLQVKIADYEQGGREGVILCAETFKEGQPAGKGALEGGRPDDHRGRGEMQTGSILCFKYPTEYVLLPHPHVGQSSVSLELFKARLQDFVPRALGLSRAVSNDPHGC